MAMLQETFDKGVTDFTKLVERAMTADVKLVQENNTVAVWLIGLSTGGFIFVIANSNPAIKSALGPWMPYLIVLQGIQVISALIMRIVTKSNLTYFEQKLMLLTMQEIYLKRTPKHNELEESDLFSMYNWLDQFHFMREVWSEYIEKIRIGLRYSSVMIGWSFGITVLSFIVNYFCILMVLWRTNPSE